jgi:hypothetical protein
MKDGYWFCPKCRVEVSPMHVTFWETHDERAGGCGCLVDNHPPQDDEIIAGASVNAEKMRMCEWHREATDSNCWSSDCGNAFEINEGTPEENSMTYCCFCGHPIEGIDSND